jgi:O-antigen/teichoic acid export membrane protein
MIQEIKKEIHKKLNSRVFMNFFWNSSGQIVNVVFFVFLNIFLARFLEPIDYGRVQLAQAVIFFVSTIDQVVYTPLARKLYVQNPAEHITILRAYSAIVTKAYSWVFAFFLFCYFLFREAISDPIPYQIGLCQLALLPFNRYIAHVDLFNSRLMSRKAMALLNISNIISIAGVVLCVLAKVPLFFLGFAFGLKSLVMWFLSERFIEKLDDSTLNQDSIDRFKKKLFYESRVYFFNDFLQKIISRSDRLILGFLQGPAMVAFYVAGIKLSEPWNMFVGSVSMSKHPSLVKSAEKGNEFLYKNYIKYLRVINVFSLFLLLFGTFFARKIILLAYGSKYEPSVFVLKLNMWVLPFLFWWGSEPNLAVLLGIGRKIFYKNILAALISVGLNFLLIPKMGINGSLYANVVTYAFLGCFGNLLFKETRILFKLQMQSLLIFNILSKKPQVIDK